MPVAISTLCWRTRPSLRTRITKASTRMKGYAWAVSSRSFHACTMGSRRLHKSDTVEREISVPHSSSVTALTLRVETPLTTIPPG